ncbi:hypothetical protein LOK49_LG06G01411 [Camellia lanceoleosa]|uniref:Uncharacterized protein n=1 Tax=Camellia lanceoleosa TaxID=1840588 RepID=A0ACC0HCB4_9ERIC|nr:hypothetical protein LOK49_LG06G01411 [Camellia lanceoleosa]
MRDHRHVYNQSAALRWASRTKFLSSSPSLSIATASCSSSRNNQSVLIFQLLLHVSFCSVVESRRRLEVSGDSDFQQRIATMDMLPYSIRILLEATIRNCDNFQVTKEDVEKIIDWENTSPKQDFTGVPTLVDLACMPDAMNKLGSDSNKVNTLVILENSINEPYLKNLTSCGAYISFQAMPQLLCYHIISTSLGVLFLLQSKNAVQTNMELEFQRNKERFAFLKWGSNAFQNMLVVPPGSGIVHQELGKVRNNRQNERTRLFSTSKEQSVDRERINLEYLGCFVFNTDGVLYPNSVIRVVWKITRWCHCYCLVLTVTQMLRKHGLVGKFVEFYGEGVGKISLADRTTIANMSPEYGATMGFFPVDHVALQYLKLTRRSEETVTYLRANNMFVDYNEPQQERVYSSYLHLDLADVEPCISGPKRPHDRVPLKEMKADWHSCLDRKVGFNGFAIPKEVQNKVAKFSFHGQLAELNHGSVVIAAITSCTNTSDPSVMLGAGLVAKKVCELGLGLQKYLDEHGFHIVGCGCTTCIGNSGDLDESVVSAIVENGIVVDLF